MWTIDVVMRCKDEMPYTERTLQAMHHQNGVKPRVLFMDCGSHDGSREVAELEGARVVDVDPKAYIPGAVLNRGMRLTTSDVVAFVNADCVPLDDDALMRLVTPLLTDGDVSATYGRQVARPGADPLVRVEYERAFGEGTPALRRGAFFSMAASAIRRSAWELLPFDETLRYSEDVDWTHRLRALGGGVTYAANARFEHSHDYDVRGQFVRRRGEGKADAAIYRLGGPSWIGDLARPLGGALLRDLRAGTLDGRALVTRGAQAFGYFAGRREARRQGRQS